MAIARFTTTVLERKELTDDVIILTLSCPEDFTFKEGQFVTLKVTKGEETKSRSYSILNPPSQKGKIDLCIKIVEDGFASGVFKETKVGDSFPIIGPLGHFVFKENDENQESIFLGSGTGIVPLHSMIMENVSKFPNKKFILLFGVRYRKGRFLHDEFKKLEEQHQNFTYVPILSREEGATNKGHVQNFLPEDLNGKTFYFCGLKSMIEQTKEVLLSKGVNPKDINFERFD